MSEVAVPEPLSGAEIIESILHKVREKLQRDCFLSPNSAYEFFTGKIHIELVAIDCGRPAEVIIDVTHETGSLPEGAAGMEPEIVDVLIEKEPPNVVRRESGQGVPIQTEDSSGRKEVRRVTYKPKGEAKAAPKVE